jgi:hypothetical protein
MNRKSAFRFALVALLGFGVLSAPAAQYLVTGSDGPTFATPEEAVAVLEGVVLPTFDALQKLEKDHKILAGGLPVGDRAFTFIVEAASNDEVDMLLRDLPIWPLLKWKVIPLQSFASRGDKEHSVVADLKKVAKSDK